jgi:hypothetical protein
MGSQYSSLSASLFALSESKSSPTERQDPQLVFKLHRMHLLPVHPKLGDITCQLLIPFGCDDDLDIRSQQSLKLRSRSNEVQ